MLLSLEAYIMLPQLQYNAAQIIPHAHIATSIGLMVMAFILQCRQSVVLTSALMCTLAFITLLCPMWLVRIQKFKAKINGPWDEAVPKLKYANYKTRCQKMRVAV